MKKRYIFLLLFLLLVPLTGIKAITWGKIKNLDTAWSGYGCYFLYNGDNQDYNYSFTPTYTSQSHTTSNDVRCHSGGFENGETGLYPLTNMYGCNLTPAQFKSARSTDSDNINGVYNGGGYNISYNNWSSSGASIADCIAGVIIGNSDLSQRRTEIEENILVEAQKNSDFLSSEEMEKMKAYYSDFNDDTQFCFVRGHQGDEYATYFGHIYADITFQDYLFHDSSTKDTDKRELITFPSDAPSDDAFSITVFPDITQTIEILDLKEYNGQMTDNHSVIVLNKGKLITDASICNKEVIDAFIQDDEEAIDSLDDEVLKDVIDGNFEWWLGKGYKKSKAIDICIDKEKTAEKEKCYRYTFAPTIGHPMYNTTVWSSRPISCGFVETTWTYDQCKDGSIAGMYSEKITVTKVKKDTTITTTYDRKITKSGYNGVADFFDKTDKSESGYKCSNFKVVHIIYRAFIIFAPIMTILFVSFDLVSSLISGDAQKVKKFRDKLFRRIIALVLLIVIPIIINVLVNTLSKNNFIKDKSVIKCVVLGK